MKNTHIKMLFRYNNLATHGNRSTSINAVGVVVLYKHPAALTFPVTMIRHVILEFTVV